MPALCWGIGRVTDAPPFERYSGHELTFVARGLDRIEADIRELRSDINGLKSTVALKNDMYKIFGLMVLAAAGAAGAVAFILGQAS